MQHPILSIIGAGGKTTALLALARVLTGQRVLLTTSTHIYPVAPPQSRALLIDPEADELLDALAAPGIVCAGTDAGAGKLGALAPALFRQAVQAADITLCEADGAHHLPLKLHRADEPVVPLDSARCVVVAGLSAWGRPVGEAVHRFALHPGLGARLRAPGGRGRNSVLRARSRGQKPSAARAGARGAESGGYARPARAGCAAYPPAVPRGTALPCRQACKPRRMCSRSGALTGCKRPPFGNICRKSIKSCKKTADSHESASIWSE